MKQIELFLTLARCNIQPNIKKFIFDAYDGNIENCLDVVKNKFELPNKATISTEIATTLKNNCDFISINNDTYPTLLKKIDSSPLLLTIKGNKEILTKNLVSSVGTRKPEIDDIKEISTIIQQICNDFVVVSGLAFGSDSIVHLNSYKTGTIAVLANGLGNCYPQENKNFIDNIIENNGCIVSEYAFDDKPMEYTFLQRDRLIAGVSISTLIMRARQQKCGTIATANYAKKYNRKIYTILPKQGECMGNQWLLNNNYAEKITNIEDLKYQLFIDMFDLANNIIDKNKQNNTKKQQQLFHNELAENDKQSISLEIHKIIKLKRLALITTNNIIKTYNTICGINTNLDSNITKQILIEMLQPNYEK